MGMCPKVGGNCLKRSNLLYSLLITRLCSGPALLSKHLASRRLTSITTEARLAFFLYLTIPMLATKSVMLVKSLARQPFLFQAATQRLMATTPDMKINATESHPVGAEHAVYL